MITSTLAEERPAARAYTSLLLRLDDLMREGKGDTPEADAIREEMDAPWYAMTESEQVRMRGLSEDLYSLSEGGVKSVAMSPAEKSVWSADARAALRNSNDPDIALAFLRRPVPEGMPAYAIRFLQSRFWEAIGDLDVALRFMREAERLDPSQAVCVLILLDKMGEKKEAEKYASRILDDRKSSAEELFLAVAVFLLPTRSMATSEARPILERVVPPLNRAWAAASSSRMTNLDIPHADVFITFMLGFCYERLGQASKAVKIYSDTLERYPNHAELLAGIGMARYDLDRAAALGDFERAVRAGTTSMWPFYFLAENFFEKEQYHQAWRLCVEGLDCQGPNIARAQLYEWLGMSQAMLGQSLQHVVDAFDQAERWDPQNDRIRFNRKVAESIAANQSKSKRPWKSQPTAGTNHWWLIRQGQLNRVQDYLENEHRGSATAALAVAT